MHSRLSYTIPQQGCMAFTHFALAQPCFGEAICLQRCGISRLISLLCSVLAAEARSARNRCEWVGWGECFGVSAAWLHLHLVETCACVTRITCMLELTPPVMWCKQCTATSRFGYSPSCLLLGQKYHQMMTAQLNQNVSPTLLLPCRTEAAGGDTHAAYSEMGKQQTASGGQGE